MKRYRPMLKAILIALLLNELRGIAVSGAVLGVAALANIVAQLTTGATFLPMETLP